MSFETTDALVVKSVDYSESSLILTLFTREFGKVSGLAKGARRLKNPFETSLDLLASIRLSFIRKNTDALDLLTEAKLKRRFRPTFRNYRGLCAGYYVAELLDLATADYEPFPDLFAFADLTLERFQFRQNVPARVAFFETALLNAFGEFPATRYCVDCGEALPLDAVTNLARRIYFDLNSGGVVCARCRARKTYLSLTPTTIGALKLCETALHGAESCVEHAKTLQTWRRALEEEAKGLSSIDQQEKESQIQEAFDRLDDESLEPFEAFSQEVKDSYRDLINRYICSVLRRRPRTFDYMTTIWAPPPVATRASDRKQTESTPGPARQPKS